MLNEFTVTVPAAGEKVYIAAKGRGIIVYQMPLYQSVDAVPQMHIRAQHKPGQRLFPLSQYRDTEGVDDPFYGVWIQGTAESENDEITLAITDFPVQPELKPQFTQDEARDYDTTGTTESESSTDVAKAIPNSVKYESGAATGKRAKRVLVTVETADIRVAWGAAPTQAGLGHLWAADSTWELSNWHEIVNFQYISKTAGTPATVTFTPIY